MKSTIKFLPFPLSLIPNDRITFPFKIYAFNPMYEVYELVCDANHGFIDHNRDLAMICLYKGGHLAIKESQFITFVRDLGLAFSFPKQLVRSYAQNRDNDQRLLTRMFKNHKQYSNFDDDQMTQTLKNGSAMDSRILSYSVTLSNPNDINSFVEFEQTSPYAEEIKEQLLTKLKEELILTQDQEIIGITDEGSPIIQNKQKTNQDELIDNEQKKSQNKSEDEITSQNNKTDRQENEQENDEQKKLDDTAQDQKVDSEKASESESESEIEDNVIALRGKDHENAGDYDIEQNILNRPLKDEDIIPVDKDSKVAMPSAEDYNEAKATVEEIAKSMGACLDADDFLEFILMAREEILAMPDNVSHSLSLARELTRILLDKDSFHNRIIAFTYYTARFNSITEMEDFGDLICASYLYDIGLTQMETHFSYTPFENINYDERHTFDKHGGLSLHLIRKNGAKLSKRCLKIIEDHHERASGNGFPLRKTEYAMEPLSQYLGLVDHVFWFASGLITGKEYRLEKVVEMIKNRVPTPGIELDFNDNMVAALSQVIRSDFREKENDKEKEVDKKLKAA